MKRRQSAFLFIYIWKCRVEVYDIKFYSLFELQISFHGENSQILFNRGVTLQHLSIVNKRKKTKRQNVKICNSMFSFWLKLSFESKLIPQFQFISFIQIFCMHSIAPALTESLAYSLSHSRHCLHNRWRSAKSFSSSFGDSFLLLRWIFENLTGRGSDSSYISMNFIKLLTLAIRSPKKSSILIMRRASSHKF